MRRVLNCPYYEKIINGLRTYSFKSDLINRFIICLALPFGANMKEYTIDGKSVLTGAAHVLEHRLFSSINGQVFDLCLENGLSTNAETGRNYTAYYIIGNKSDLKKALKILFDLFFYIKRDDAQLEVEKKIILSESKLDKDEQDSLLDTFVEQNLYKGTHLENSIIGKDDDIKSVNYDDLILYHEAFYTRENAFFIISGDFKNKELYEFINNYNFKNKIRHDVKKDIHKMKDEIIESPVELELPLCQLVFSLSDEFIKKYPLYYVYFDLLSDLFDFDKNVDALKERNIINDEISLDYYIDDEIKTLTLTTSSNQYIKNHLIDLVKTFKDTINVTYINNFKSEKRISKILNFSFYNVYNDILNSLINKYDFVDSVNYDYDISINDFKNFLDELLKQKISYVYMKR